MRKRVESIIIYFAIFCIFFGFAFCFAAEKRTNETARTAQEQFEGFGEAEKIIASKQPEGTSLEITFVPCKLHDNAVLYCDYFLSNSFAPVQKYSDLGLDVVEVTQASDTIAQIQTEIGSVFYVQIDAVTPLTKEEWETWLSDVKTENEDVESLEKLIENEENPVIL